MVIRIFLLQHPHIEIDGREAFLKLNKKSLAMICYLAARQGQTVSRELLSEIFWPEQQEEAERGLQNCGSGTEDTLSAGSGRRLPGRHFRRTFCQRQCGI